MGGRRGRKRRSERYGDRERLFVNTDKYSFFAIFNIAVARITCQQPTSNTLLLRLK